MIYFFNQQQKRIKKLRQETTAVAPLVWKKSTLKLALCYHSFEIIVAKEKAFFRYWSR